MRLWLTALAAPPMKCRSKSDSRGYPLPEQWQVTNSWPPGRGILPHWRMKSLVLSHAHLSRRILPHERPAHWPGRWSGAQERPLTKEANSATAWYLGARGHRMIGMAPGVARQGRG